MSNAGPAVTDHIRRTTAHVRTFEFSSPAGPVRERGIDAARAAWKLFHIQDVIVDVATARIISAA